MICGIWISGYSVIAAAGIIPAVFLLCDAVLRTDDDRNRDMRRFAAICAAAALFGALYLQAAEIRYLKAYKMAGKELDVTAEVLKTEQKPGRHVKLIVRFLSVKPDIRMNNVKAVMTVKTDIDTPWKLTGSVIRFSVMPEIPDSRRNPRCFDYRSYLKSEGIALIGSIGTFHTVKGSYSVFSLARRRLTAIRELFLEKVTEGQDEDTEALIRGTLFGDTQKLPDDMKEDFRRNGTAHILAVSGLHIGLLYSVFTSLRKKFTLPGITAVFMILLLAYGTMTMWTVSVTRAVIMIIVLEAADRLDRRYDILTSLGSVSMLVLLHNPYALFGASFQMSFLAVLSLGTVKPRLEEMIPEWIPASLLTSVSVLIGLVPYTIYNFNFIPLASLAVNIPVICLMTAIASSALILTAPFLLMHLVPPLNGICAVLITHAGFLVTIPSDMMIRINSFFADLSFLSPDVISPPGYLVMLVYGILFLLTSEGFMIARIRKNYTIMSVYSVLVISIMIISVIAFSSPFDEADIVMADVGQGDCVHLRFRNRIVFDTDVMIDGGGSEKYNTGKNTLKPYLLKNKAGRIELALATHLHTDHYKGIKELAAEHMIKRLVTKGKSGDIIWISDKRDRNADHIEILYPDTYERDTEDENRNSLIFKVFINGITMLVTGDLGEEGEHALVEKYRDTGVLDCDVLKVCHHGSRYSSSEEFLDAVSPEVALIGVGENNTYGHPSDEAIKRLERCGARVYRTDLDGAVGVRRRHGKLRICTMSPKHISLDYLTVTAIKSSYKKESVF